MSHTATNTASHAAAPNIINTGNTQPFSHEDDWRDVGCAPAQQQRCVAVMGMTGGRFAAALRRQPSLLVMGMTGALCRCAEAAATPSSHGDDRCGLPLTAAAAMASSHGDDRREVQLRCGIHSRPCQSCRHGFQAASKAKPECDACDRARAAAGCAVLC